MVAPATTLLAVLLVAFVSLSSARNIQMPHFRVAAATATLGSATVLDHSNHSNENPLAEIGRHHR